MKFKCNKTKLTNFKKKIKPSEQMIKMMNKLLCYYLFNLTNFLKRFIVQVLEGTFKTCL